MAYTLYVRTEGGWEKVADLDAVDREDALAEGLSRLNASHHDKPIALQSADGQAEIIEPDDPRRRAAP